MTGIREFIEKRREQLRSDRQPLEARRDELRQELRKIERQLDESFHEWEELDRAARALDDDSYARPANKLPTIKESVLKVLADAPEQQMTSTDILAAINERFYEGTMERTSLSPQLSRLKNEKKIELNGNLWRKRPDAEDLLS